MTTLGQLREGMSQAWDTLVDGWQHLYRRASNAITRFNPGAEGGAGAGTEKEIAVRSSGWGVLAAEVFDDHDKVVVRLEAPGMEAGDFDLEVLDDVLVVRGRKQIERERSEGRYHILECAYGSFERAIPLPEPVEASGASARYKKGVLRVELPKPRSRPNRPIEVKAG